MNEAGLAPVTIRTLHALWAFKRENSMSLVVFCDSCSVFGNQFGPRWTEVLGISMHKRQRNAKDGLIELT
ncbi:hypothetical protein E2542_SST17385 [Spatholobus suberectus]|nr:hypothetical protein E2542_SST17385 [Spatholobus suberectus]